MFRSIRVGYLLLVLGCCALRIPAYAQHSFTPPDTEATRADDAAAQANPQRPLEVVFCLDVSGSMGGRNKDAIDWMLDTLHEWYLKRPVRVGLVAYYEPGTTWIVPFDSDPTEFERALTLPMGGAFGDETVGNFINVALDSHINSWTPGAEVEKRIVVVGNERMNVGPSGVSYENATLAAAANGWHIDATEGASRASWTFMITPELNQWQHMALIGRGVYSSFASNGKHSTASNYQDADVRPEQNSAPETTPFDQQLRALNWEWNQTIIPVGRVATNNWRAVMEEERELDRIGVLYAVMLPKINATRADWELIDGWQTGAMDLAKISPSQLPPIWRMADPKLLAQALKRTLIIRLRVQQAIVVLLQQRALWIQQQRLEQIGAAQNRLQLALQNAQQQAQNVAQNPLTPNQLPPDALPNSARLERIPVSTAPNFNSERAALPAPFEGPQVLAQRQNDGTNAPKTPRVLDEGGTMSAPVEEANDLAEMDDEFASSASLPRWQRDQTKPENYHAPKIDDGLRLENSGTLFKDVEGDFAVTVRLKFDSIEADKTAADNDAANDFALALRLPPEISTTDAAAQSQFAVPPDDKLRQVAWRVALSKEKAVPRLEPKATDDAAAPAEAKSADEIRLRLARVGSKVVALQEVAGQWQLCGRFDITGWPKTLPVALISPSHDEARVAAVHFQRLKFKTFPAAPAQWLELAGATLDKTP